MLIVGETDVKAKKLLSDIQAQLTSNRRLIWDYGEKYNCGDWADGDFTTSDGVKFTAIGFGSSPRGSRSGNARPDYIVCDDIDSRKHVNNDRMMEDGMSYISEDVWGCFDKAENATSRFVYANNNFHKNSITNRLKSHFNTSREKDKNDGIKTIFHVIRVDAVKDLESFEPNWPEKTTEEFWRKEYNSQTYRSFMREYMNTHIGEGTIFKPENMCWGKMLPYDQYEALVFYGDLSYKDQGDYKGLILVGKKGREFHVIHTYLSRGSRLKCARWLYELYIKKHLDRYNIKYMVEGLFAMDEFVNDFDSVGDAYGFYIPVIADKKTKDGKYDRIESMSGFFERKNVIFNIEEKEYADQVTLVDQLQAFEKGSKANDDGPDALQSAMRELNKSTFVSNFEPVIISRSQARSNKNSY